MLRAASSPSVLLRPISPLIIVRVRELSRLRRGLTGGSGGGEPPPALLSDLDLDWLLDRASASRASVTDMVGTRLVDMMKVGSEISLLLMTLFIESVSVLVVVLGCAIEGLRGGGYVGVGGADPLASLDVKPPRDCSNGGPRGESGEAPADKGSLPVRRGRALRLVPELVLSRNGPGTTD